MHFLQVEILNSLEDERIKDVQYNGEYLIEEGNKIWIGVSRADGSKCDRCWNYSPQVGSFTEHPLLCGRCHNVVIGLPIRDPEDLAKVTQSEAKEAIAQ